MLHTPSITTLWDINYRWPILQEPCQIHSLIQGIEPGYNSEVCPCMQAIAAVDLESFINLERSWHWRDNSTVNLGLPVSSGLCVCLYVCVRVFECVWVGVCV